MSHTPTAIITGASAGVGAACARKLASRGYNLVLVARGEEALRSIEEELSAQSKILIIARDVGDTSACDFIVKQAYHYFGGIDILINNAGLHHRGDVSSRTATELASMVDINLRTPIQLTTTALPYLQRSPKAAIVMVGSLAGRAPLQGAATYAATKAGLRAFTYALADELQDSTINVGVVSPGPINTGFIMDDIDEVEDIVYSQPMSTVAEVATAVANVIDRGEVEVVLPKISGFLTTLSYLSPLLRRITRPALYEKGRKNKEKYRAKRAS